jgi:hypothetical protein
MSVEENGGSSTIEILLNDKILFENGKWSWQTLSNSLTFSCLKNY